VPSNYFLVTQVLVYGDCVGTSLLGIDGWTVRRLAKSGCKFIPGEKLAAEDRKRIEGVLLDLAQERGWRLREALDGSSRMAESVKTVQ
jgi:hypothetical protein